MAAEEGAEKPVREQFKKASIGGMSEEARAAAAVGEAKNDPAESEQTATEDKKKGIEKTVEAPDEEAPATSIRHHTRKRSRDSTAEDDDLNEHKRKISGERSRAQSPAVEHVSANGTLKPKDGDRSSTPDPTTNETTGSTMISPKVKRSKIQGDEATAEAENGNSTTTEQAKIPPGSGFANTSSASPFGTLASKKSPTPSDEPAQTSSSAFAASGFGSLAGSASSGFGTIGKSSGGFGPGGGFGSGSKSPLGAQANDEDAKSSGSAFGGSLGQKSAFAAPASSGTSFGSGASGFGKIGQSSGLGSGLGGGSGFGSGGGGLTTFASGKSTPLSGVIKQKAAFGAPADDDEDGEDGGEDDATAGSKSPLAVEEDEKDERFFERDVETGEEDEITKYSCRAKLYNYSTLPDGKKEWRERGLGVLRLNVKAAEDGDDNSKPKARFLMRADGSHRVVLNTPIKKEIKFGTPSGGPPTNGFIYFMGTFDGRDNLEMLQIKVRLTAIIINVSTSKKLIFHFQIRQQFALELYDNIVALQQEM